MFSVCSKVCSKLAFYVRNTFFNFISSKHGVVAAGGDNTIFMAGGESPDSTPNETFWQFNTVLGILSNFLFYRNFTRELTRCTFKKLYKMKLLQNIMSFGRGAIL